MKTRTRKRKVPAKFSRKMQKKLIVMSMLFFLILIGLIVRLTYIGKASGKKYEKIVLNQQQYDNQNIPYKRGDIVDRKGTVLATSLDVYNVILDCKVINEDKKYVKAVTKALVEHFEVTEEEITEVLTEKKDIRYFRLRRKLSYETIQPYVEKMNDTKKNPNLRGVWFEKEYQRYYPFESLGAKVLGYTTSGNVGIGGVEDYYNDTLNGTDGRQYGYLNEDSNLEKTIKEPVNGENIVLTIDSNIQSIVEDKIREFDEAHANEAREGRGSVNTAVLITDPTNGAVLAMSDSNFYDPNNPRDLTAYYEEAQVNGMSEEDQLKVLNEIWSNYCITTTYEPGSTIKPMTVATGLESGKVSSDTTYFCDGSQKVPGYSKPIACTGIHETQTLEQVLMNSCNDALIQMSDQIGVEEFSKYQDLFQFGRKTNIDLPGEASGIRYYADNMKLIDLATNAFGQNVNLTMIQVASAFSSLINGGYYYQPRVVSKIVDEDGNTSKEIKPILLKQTVSEQTSELLKQYLYATATDGSANYAKIQGYSMGGKTGTAEIAGRNKRDYVLSFIGYLPADNPKVQIYVIIDQPNVAEQAHSSIASEFAKGILTEILPYLNVFQDEEIENPEEESETSESEQTPETETPANGDEIIPE